MNDNTKDANREERRLKFKMFLLDHPFIKSIFSIPGLIIAIVMIHALISRSSISFEKNGIAATVFSLILTYIILMNIYYRVWGKRWYARKRIMAKNYDDMDGHEFEHYCAEILKRSGFYNVRVTQGSGDYGIDILANKGNVSYAIQCKCYSSNIGNKAVQEAYTGKTFYGTDSAVVLTNRYFTKAAIETAARTGVELWDRDVLNVYVNNSRRKQRR